MIKRIKEFLKAKPFPASKHIIKEAFEVGGIKYYEFDTTANLPYQRGLKFISIYNEMDMRADKYYLEQHVAATDKLLSGKISLEELSKIKMYNNQLKERLQWVMQEDMIYKIASVVFFDANENPNDWEWKYADEKIKHWKKHSTTVAFFLQEPMVRLIPFLKGSETNLQTYLQAVKAMDEAHLANILTPLSRGQKPVLPNYTERYFSREMKAGLEQ